MSRASNHHGFGVFIKHWEPALLFAMVALVFMFSAIKPFSFQVWFLEVAPVLLGAVLLLTTRLSFPLTMLLYRLLALHALILIIGGHYAYARVPIGFWVQDLFDFSRNHYDRLGHLAQGFIPAILSREILLRRSPLVPGKWLFFVVLCVCLAFSAFYELIEWWVALLDDGVAQDFLGSQGDVWDTQWDMFLALIGALSSQIFLTKAHDRALAGLSGRLRETQEDGGRTP
jgi:putative membrane protein